MKENNKKIKNIKKYINKGNASVLQQLKQIQQEKKEIEKEKRQLEKEKTELAERLKQRNIITGGRYPKKYLFGALGDTQYGSLYANQDIIDLAYKEFVKEGVKIVYHTGDLVDGENVYKGHTYEINVHGFDAQTKKVVDNYPYYKGIVTKFITGNHDLSYWKSIGADVGSHINNQREDMQYLGREQILEEVMIGKQKVKILLVHPGKGSAYAISYHSQKFIEAISGGRKPHLVLSGHTHKAIHIPGYRNVDLFQTGCTQSQTPFMMRNNLAAVTGFWIIEVTINTKRLVAVKAKFYHFFEK